MAADFARGGESEAGAPPRPPHEPDACKLVLTTRAAPNQIVFEHASNLRAGTPHVALTLSSHPGCAVVVRVTSGPHHVGHPWMADELGVGPARSAAMATLDRSGFLLSSHGTAPGKVLDVSMWKYEPGNEVNFVGSQHTRRETFKAGGGRTFALNDDGTMSPAQAPHLVVGFAPADCTLVAAAASERLVLDAAAADALRSGRVAPLTLASHPGCAIVPKTDVPRRIDDWHISFQHLGVGAARDAMRVRQEGPFLLSAHPSTHDFILDVPFGALNVHCRGDHGPLPIAAINIERGTNKEHHNAARLFQLNKDNTISPQKAPHLVFGIRGQIVSSAADVAPSVPVEGAVSSVANVIMGAVMGMPMGTPVESGGASGKPLESMTLMEMAEELKRQLGLKDMGSVNDTVKAAADEVGVAVEGKPLIALAKECLTAVGYGV